ncbi:DUF3597 family protein [Phenylobacterium sp.]|uniref:DUF3597 family protein n=1 Tax=Phenylobacterium sp. TaxID=1871053 RepID=UPI0025D8F3DA|nr:DUF3597 family protein [Phenylobacterium sp.]
MSLMDRIIERLFHGDNGLAPRDWVAPAARDAHQPPPIERTAMAPPSDVAILLNARAEAAGLGDAWRHSLDGLLTLLGLDASLAERKELAAELNIGAGRPGSSTHDAALYEALIQRLAENGAVAPESFYK